MMQMDSGGGPFPNDGLHQLFRHYLSRARNTQFDHKKAISDPLTEVCADAIRMNLSQKQTTANRNNQKNRN